MKHRSVRAAACALLAWSLSAGAAPAAAQIDQWPNSPQPRSGRQVVPFMEGWYDNGDGTFTISFGYLNRNPEETVEIPLGERNYIEPARFDGVQPTTFHPSRNRGVFAVTIPASMRDQDIWWYLTDTDGQVYKVPGRARANAYQLDWNPRPHGSLPPLAWFSSERDAVMGPEGAYADQVLTGRVGQPVTLTVSTRDPSERDPSDRRFARPLPVRVTWYKYTGPEGEVTYASLPESSRGIQSGTGSRPQAIMLDGIAGTAGVRATFPAPGEYVMMAQIDNWRSPDSQAGDQCCWTNVYQRVRITP